MRRIRRHRPATVLVVACIGLTISIGGTSYAADQLRNDAVTSLKDKNAHPGANTTNAATPTTPGSAQGTNAATAR